MKNGKLTIIDNAIPPRRAYKGDAGLDIAIQNDVTIYPGETEYLPAGIKLDLPVGKAAMVMTRSSTSKHRVAIVPTLIDHNYKEEISTIVSNFNTYPVTIKKGLKLAQVVLIDYYEFDNEHEVLDHHQNERQSGHKFGSSGH